MPAIVIGIVWYPYLRFEASPRGFVDLQLQVFRQSMRPTNFKNFWCNPALAPAIWQNHTASLGPDLGKAPISAGAIRNKLLEYGKFFLGNHFPKSFTELKF